MAMLREEGEELFERKGKEGEEKVMQVGWRS